MATVRDLTITSWLVEPGDEALTIAVPGLKLTGWWPDAPPEVRAFDELKTIWPDRSVSVKIEIDILEDPDRKKHQACAYLRVRWYSAQWLDLLGKSLEVFVRRGAAISWAGGWECFLQYSPTEVFLGCYAAYTAATGLICAGGLDAPITYLEKIPGVAQRLHAAAQDVIDARRARL